MRRPPSWLIPVVAFIAFISLGLPDAILGVAWPSIRDEFDLPSAGIGFILFSSSIGYFLSSTFAGTIMRYLSLGWLLVISTVLVAVGLVGYSLAPFTPWFMLLAFGIGSGSGAIDTGLNAYASRHWSAARMNWLHGFFGVGAMIGPLVMTAVLTSGDAWQRGYQVVGVAIAAMAIVFVLTRTLWDAADGPVTAATGDAPAAASVSLWQALLVRITLVQAAVFIALVALEVTVGQWSFSVLRERFDASEGMAGFWVGMYWAALAAGRLAIGPFIDRIGAGLVVRYSLLVAVAGAALFVLPDYRAAVAGVLLIGGGIATVFPTLITLTARRMPTRYVTHVIGLSVGAAVIGGASFPTIAGRLHDALGVTAIAWLVAGIAVATFVLNEVLDRMGRTSLSTLD